MTPRAAALSVCHEDEDPRVVAIVERAVREDRARGAADVRRHLALARGGIGDDGQDVNPDDQIGYALAALDRWVGP